jgi:hypothetical protein
VAYCLLGIFDVQMPVLYGEGVQAFIRLLEEIIKKVEDHSIFLRFTGEAPTNISHRSGVLAKHPRMFKGLRDLYISPSIDWEPLSVANKGIRIQLPFLQVENGSYARVALFDYRPDCCEYAAFRLRSAGEARSEARGEATDDLHVSIASIYTRLALRLRYLYKQCFHQLHDQYLGAARNTDHFPSKFYRLVSGAST